MRNLMGTSKSHRKQGGNDITLPDPLPADALPRMAHDNTVRLHNPEWNEKISHQTNQEFIWAAVRQIQDNEKVCEILSDHLLLSADISIMVGKAHAVEGYD